MLAIESILCKLGTGGSARKTRLIPDGGPDGLRGGIPGLIEPLEPRTLMTRNYCGSHIYRNGALERIENSYGYWADSCYHYRITDYQGNVRAVIS